MYIALLGMSKLFLGLLFRGVLDVLISCRQQNSIGTSSRGGGVSWYILLYCHSVAFIESLFYPKGAHHQDSQTDLVCCCSSFFH